MSKEQKDLKKKGKGSGAICMSREGIENQLVLAALKGATRKREISVHDMKMIRRHFHDDINIAVVCLQWHLGRHQIIARRELLSTTPATGTWKTQSTVPPMNKAETSIVRIPVRMMLDLLVEHLGLHKAI
ncbi:uncharacterized protein LOC119368362 isoform X1 [Triticum dicoccoides]|uniref:uncharacterized protein LOC119368362 isoform X1 n=1 Tax=Triticum dicoccoides TaxID=85692 RepID=UPI00188F8F7E|nr:uncharacterized protein LOC119368362 isoform X1 [Triticum dicoccoides]